MSERAAPQYCPYCGDEDLRPEEPPAGSPTGGHGLWRCRACARVFKVSFVGLSALSLGEVSRDADRAQRQDLAVTAS